MNDPRQRDLYANLLRESRGLQRDQASARDLWYASVADPKKEEYLFELEMLLKGIACTSNPRNNPGPPRERSVPGHDFREDLLVVRDAIDRALLRVRNLLGPRERAFAFGRYLETVMPEDFERGRLMREQLRQTTPERSLFVLRHAFEDFLVFCDALLQPKHVSGRSYRALVETILREVSRNAFFNPLSSLEFRPELDIIRSADVLEVLRTVRTEGAHRVAALALLTLHRGLRYISLLRSYAAEAKGARRCFAILAVLRSDMRVLSHHLGHRACHIMAEGLEHELLELSSDELLQRQSELDDQAGALLTLRRAFENVATLIRVEVRVAFEHHLPSIGDNLSEQDLAARIAATLPSLESMLRQAVQLICLGIRADFVTTPETEGALVLRRRRDAWMFAQILRGFSAKTMAAGEVRDDWSDASDLGFVREFLHHYRAIGEALVQSIHYPDIERFIEAIESLQDLNLLDTEALGRAAYQCNDLRAFLDELFATITAGLAESDQPFSRKAAAETLKVYLGA